MQSKNPGWDNPNTPNQGWGQQNPNQDWGQLNPEMPDYDPNAQARGRGQQNPNYDPNYDPNAQGWGTQPQQAPRQGAPGQQAPLQGQADLFAAPSGAPYSDADWKTLLTAPLHAGKAMMFASPSGPIGMLQETKAMIDSLQSLLNQNAASPLMRALAQSGQRIMDAARAGNPQQMLNDLAGPSRDPIVCRTEALNSCQQASAILRNTPPQDAGEYKQFAFNMAQKVAEAASEGGFLSLGGGSRVSPAEADLLREIAGALGMQRT